MTHPQDAGRAPDRTLSDVRADVAAIDREILCALARRERLVDEAVAFKASADDITDADLRRQLLDRIDGWAAECGTSARLARLVYQAILEFVIPRQLEVFARRNVPATGSQDAQPFKHPEHP
jgi:isochorismate pyruvate lyase